MEVARSDNSFRFPKTMFPRIARKAKELSHVKRRSKGGGGGGEGGGVEEVEEEEEEKGKKKRRRWQGKGRRKNYHQSICNGIVF